jgi:hypothetical protein
VTHVNENEPEVINCLTLANPASVCVFTVPEIRLNVRPIGTYTSTAPDPPAKLVSAVAVPSPPAPEFGAPAEGKLLNPPPSPPIE